MKPTMLLLLTGLLLSSCASLLNRPYKGISVITSAPALVVLKNDTLSAYRNQSQVVVPRQRKALQFKIIGDSLTKLVTVEPRNSFAYWLNAYPTPLLGTGFLIDKNNPKRYDYPSRVYVDLSDSVSRHVGYDPRNQQGNICLQVSLPHVNSFLLKPDREENYKASVGFWGLTLGLDFYHSPRQFVSVSASAISDYFLPVPAAVDMSGEYELMTSTYLALSNNHRMRRFSMGYGISFSRNSWDLSYHDWGNPPPPTREPVTRSNEAFGMVFPVTYQAGEHFYIGTVYRPTLFRLSAVTPVTYEHVISVEIGWKIKLNK